MGVEDGFDDDWVDYRQPPALDDRLWRHPAEIGRLGTAPPPPRPRRSPWALGFVSVVGCALLAGSLMFTAGGIGEEPRRLGLQPLATLVAHPSGGTGTGIVTVGVDSRSDSRQGNGMVLEDGVHVVTSLQLIPAEAPGETHAVSIRIIDTDGVVHPGAVVARDPLNDLAIIRTQGPALPPWVAVSPADGEVGDEVSALGGGLGTGLRRWQSSIRSVGESMRNDAFEVVGLTLLADALPAVATGSPVIGPRGGFLGMLSVDLGSGHDSSAAALTATIVPATRVLAATRQFLATGRISHGWLGVEAPSSVDTTQRVSLRAGATVDHVVADSPAGAAGVRPGDVLLSVCGHDVDSIDDVLTEVLATPPGTICPLEILRAGKPWSTKAVIGERAA